MIYGNAFIIGIECTTIRTETTFDQTIVVTIGNSPTAEQSVTLWFTSVENSSNWTTVDTNYLAPCANGIIFR